jgi:hypothetical protein
MSEFRFESIKYRFADATRNISNDTSDGSAYRVLCIFGANYTLHGYVKRLVE